MVNDEKWTGLNGTTLLRASDVKVGYVPGEPYGHKTRLPVTIDVRMERLERSSVYETVTHEKIEQPTSFALTTAVWKPFMNDWESGGANVDPLREVLKTKRLSDQRREDLHRLIGWFDGYHLNDMQAGCDHQTVLWEEEPYRRPWLWDPKTETGTLPCPITGYRYGSKWLVKPLPADMVKDVLRVLHHLGVDPTGEAAE